VSASEPARKARILIVDDDPIVVDSLAELLESEGYACVGCHSGVEALERVARAEEQGEKPIALAVCDISMPGMGGLDLLERLTRRHPAVVPLMITGYGAIESAVKAIKLGAADYLTKPIVDEELRVAIEKAIRQHHLLAENATLRKQLDERFGLDSIVGHDHCMQRAFELIEAVAPTKTTVLMTGESGTGKSLVARAIHQRSDRRDKPFVEISCGSIPETILESELFGHVKGAFTGAHADKTGRFLAAEGGTIFLDEINSASPGMQLKLLRVLQERRFEPVGSTETREVDVRVILATNQNLEDLVAAGAFRQDLYYRINVVKIDLPPLRDRPGDIPALAEHFLRMHAAETGKAATGFTEDAMTALARYGFPGNVRELSNIVERAVVLSPRPTIGVDSLPPHVVENRLPRTEHDSVDAPDTPWEPTPLAEALMAPERRILLKALRANDWNRQRTADDLGINRTTLYKKMKAHGLDRMAG